MGVKAVESPQKPLLLYHHHHLLLLLYVEI
jgi:hypothetical protein